MAGLDLLVRGARVLTSDGWFDGGIAVSDERIVELIPADRDMPAARKTIDATQPGKVVIPGLVDTHIHLRDPGFTHKEDWTTGTRAAAAGGVTTVLDMPNVEPPTNTVDRFKAHIDNASAKSLVDFGHNAAGTIPENIQGLADAGATAFKVFMMADIGRDYPHMPGIAVDDHATLFRICEAIAETGKALFIHPHDQALYDLFVHRAWERWGRDFRSYARAWRDGDGVVLDSGIATMLRLQQATGVRLHILHLSTIAGFNMLRAAKQAGREVTGELNPFSLFLTNSWESIERLGPYALGIWIPDHHAMATWDALVDGTADVIATDHAPHTREEKEVGWTDMYAAPGGSPIVQHYLSLLLTQVNAGRVSLERIVDLCATRPAQLVGLYPRKGTIQVGADADLVVVDLERHDTITAARGYSKCGWTAFEGHPVHGVPIMTILRGSVIAEENEVFAAPGSGKFQRADSAQRSDALAREATPGVNASGAAHLSPSTRRDEDPRLLTGTGQYVGDLPSEDALHVAFVRSPHAHARLTSVDVSAARAAPGVVDVITGADVAHLARPAVNQQVPSASLPPHPPLASEVVRWVGAPIVAILATSRTAAADAVELVEADYHLLPAVADAERAVLPDAPLLYPERTLGNVAFQLAEHNGDFDALAARPDVLVVRQRFDVPRVAALPIETHAAVAASDGGRLTLHLSTQAPHRARAALAQALGVDPAALRIIAPDVGGAFGSKGSIQDEELLAAFAAQRLGRPVRWVATRSEEFLAAHQGRDALIDATAVFSPDGDFLGLRVRELINVGAQPGGNSINPSLRTIKLLPGPYRLQAYDAVITGVFTNTPPTGPYRGAGRPEATYVHERLMDLAAARLGMSHVEIRRRNFLEPGDFPYRTLAGVTYDSGDYHRALDVALAAADGRPSSADGKLRGTGLATYVEPSAGGSESGLISVRPDGTIQAAVGSSNQGQGHRTVFRDLVAGQLGVPRERVTLVQGDTDAIDRGTGTFGARSLVLSGSALHRAGDALIEQGRSLAAGLFEVAAADVHFKDGRFEVAGVPERAMDWGAVAAAADVTRGLLHQTSFEAESETFGFGAYVAEVAIDPDTGQVTLERMVGIDDCGTVVNHVLTTGQVQGGIAQGVGQALYEQMVFDADSAQVLSGSLQDYAAPRARHMPTLVLGHTVTPSPLNPLGAKGVGEAGSIGAPPAIANAVVDALRSHGVRHIDFPLTPERVWRAMHAPKDSE